MTSLQRWYAAHCNGDWEHTGGVKIATIDNPGWSLDVNLRETELAETPFEQLKTNYDHPTDWVFCEIKDGCFRGRCGPEKLESMIEIFLKWAAAARPSPSL